MRPLRNPRGESAAPVEMSAAARWWWCSFDPPCREKLSFQHPRLLIRVLRLALPMERMRRDGREGPSRLGAIGAGALLQDVVAVPPSDLLFAVSTDRIGPGDAPGADRRIPRTQRGAVHVHARVGIGAAMLPARHDPHVLNGPALEHPSGVNFAFESLAADVNAPIPRHLEVPAAA